MVKKIVSVFWMIYSVIAQAGDVSFTEFMSLVSDYNKFEIQQLARSSWHGKNMLASCSGVQGALKRSGYLSPSHTTFKTYVRKLVVPKNSIIAFWGDLHGDSASLDSALHKLQQRGLLDSDFRIDPNKNFYMLFLGDYVDRGKNGVEVLHRLLKLRIANPDRVFLVRGNHEDASINMRYGFGQELSSKFPDKQPEELSKIFSIYDYMPVVLYLGVKTDHKTTFLQCCHGGMEVGYNPARLLESNSTFECISKLDRAKYLNNFSLSIKEPIHKCFSFYPQELTSQTLCGPMRPYSLGFMWSDFIDDNGSAVVDYNRGRGWSFGKKLTEELLRNAETATTRLVGVFRAHQHNGTLLQKLHKGRGIAVLWNGALPVYTFIAAPGLFGVSQQEACFGLMQMTSDYKNWRPVHSDNL